MKSLIFKTATMMAAMLQKPPHATFLRDRYFPTDAGRDIFMTEDVLMDIKAGTQKMAPVVLPRKKGIVVAREAFKTERMTPPLLAPKRTLTLDDLESRGFGEALFNELSAEEREAALLAQDLQEMDIQISNREEYIAARCMLGNGYTLQQYADKVGTDEFEPYDIRFYDGANNPFKFTPAVAWNQPGATIYADMCAMVRMHTTAGNPVSDYIAAPSVIDRVIMDEDIYKMLDNRRMDFGQIAPENLPEGASYYGRISIAGRTINLFSYDIQFEDDLTGKVKPLFKSGEGVFTAPESGRGLYGAVKQVEEEDRKFHSYAGLRVPKYTSNVEDDIRTLRLASRPLLVPRYANPWVTANVFN